MFSSYHIREFAICYQFSVFLFQLKNEKERESKDFITRNWFVIDSLFLKRKFFFFRFQYNNRNFLSNSHISVELVERKIIKECILNPF